MMDEAESVSLLGSSREREREREREGGGGGHVSVSVDNESPSNSQKWRFDARHYEPTIREKLEFIRINSQNGRNTWTRVLTGASHAIAAYYQGLSDQIGTFTEMDSVGGDDDDDDGGDDDTTLSPSSPLSSPSSPSAISLAVRDKEAVLLSSSASQSTWQQQQQPQQGQQEHQREERKKRRRIRKAKRTASEQFEEEEKTAHRVWMAIRVSNACNLFLFAAKVFVTISSGSLAIMASTLDSLLDLLSGLILWFTAWSMRSQNPYKYPIGKNRMQPLGIIVFASVMASLSLQILLEGVSQLFLKEHSRMESDKVVWVVSIMVVVTFVKLALFLYCSTFSNEIVKAYAKDHIFDVITNAMGLAAALLAHAFFWWMDPVGAILLAMYTIKNWSETIIENSRSLVGQSAPPEYLQKLTYLCWNHHEAVKQIDTVRAYSFGDHYFVEVDVVLPSEMWLREAHDIGESLQNKLETLPEIERAFVHLDYECSHKPEHGSARSRT